MSKKFWDLIDAHESTPPSDTDTRQQLADEAQEELERIEAENNS